MTRDQLKARLGIGLAALLLSCGALFGAYSLGADSEEPATEEAGAPVLNSLEGATDFVEGEARYISAGERVSFDQAAALSAMNLVEVSISTPRFALRQKFSGKPLPDQPAANFKTQAGFCQGAVDSMNAVLKRLGVKTRRVEFFWGSGDDALDHVVSEVFWDGRWHMMDPTWGMFISAPGKRLQILSYAEIAGGAPREIHVNDARAWYSYSQSLDDRAAFEYLKHPGRVVADRPEIG